MSKRKKAVPARRTARPAARPVARAATPSPRKVAAMLSPFVDALCVGGASIVVAVIVLALDIRVPPQATLAMIVTGFLINAPHFLVSYRILYGSLEHRVKYRGVSVYMPLLLLFYALFALAMYPTNQVFLGAMFGAGSVLLAWHYTGQAWGMMASFGFIGGRTFTTLERRLIRSNLYVLLAWHVVWAVVVARRMFEDPGAEQWLITGSGAQALYEFVSVAAVLSGALGLTALVLQARRIGRLPTMRMLLPWVAVHMWYVLLAREPAAIFWVQNAHALQYLIFPLRVEMNRSGGQERRKPTRSLGRHMAWYYVGTVLLGLLVMQLIPEGIEVAFAYLGFNQYAATNPMQSGPIQMAVVAFINVHHYYIDNVIWKIRNPSVRQSLFGHLELQKRA